MDKDFNSFSKNTNSNEIFSYLFEKTCSSNINLIYYTDYLTYKKKLIKNIINDIELIMNFFSEEINDIIIKINILKKKNKINNDEYKIFESVYELIDSINIIDFFDQDDFLNVLLILFKIKLSIDKIIIFFDYFKFRDLIDIKFFTDRFNELFDNISKNNIFLKTLMIILLRPDENIALCEIKNLAKQISIDFFMYYDSIDLFDKILLSIDKINKIKITTNLKNNKIDKKKLTEVYFKLLKNNKNVFVNEYNYYVNKHLEIYSNYEFELKIKFKLKKKQNIIKLIENLTYISNIN